jgi:hypothetical protein
MHDVMIKILEFIYKAQFIINSQKEQLNKLKIKSNIKVTKNILAMLQYWEVPNRPKAKEFTVK